MVRAKFKLQSITRLAGIDVGTRLDFSPVYSSDPNHENKRFWDATPSGSISMTIKNQAAVDTFELGKEYYVDFTESP